MAVTATPNRTAIQFIQRYLTMKATIAALVLAVAGLTLSSCASKNPPPPQPSVDMGYSSTK
jgi:hypothetical protein